MNAVEFFQKATVHFDPAEAKALINAYGAAVDVGFGEPLLGPNPTLDALVHDVHILFYNRGLARTSWHTLRVNGKELFGAGDATGEGAGQTAGYLIGLGLSAAGLEGAGEVLATVGGTLASAAVGDRGGAAGDAASDRIRERRAGHRAKRTLNFREVLVNLDNVLGAASESLGSSTWHYRVARRIRAELQQHRADAVNPFSVPFAEDPKALKRYAYKLCSYLHHEQKVHDNLLPILVAVSSIHDRGEVWRYFWNTADSARGRPALRDFSAILAQAVRGDHQACETHGLCYGIVADEEAHPSKKKTARKKAAKGASPYGQLEDRAAGGAYRQPLTTWVNLRLGKEEVRGERVDPSRLERAREWFRKPWTRKRGDDTQSLVDHAEGGESTRETYDAAYHDDQLDADRDGLEPIAEAAPVPEEPPEEAPEELRRNFDREVFPSLTGRVVLNPHRHSALAWREQERPPTDQWTNADAQHATTAGWCKACQECVGWMLFRTYCEVKGKSLGERTRRKLTRKVKNADKRKWAITFAVTAVGVGVSIATLGVATPIAVGASLAVGATGQAASKASQIHRMQRLIALNEERAPAGSSSRSSASSLTSKQELKMDHAMIRQFTPKIRRHFKGCEEAWARMMYFVSAPDNLGIGVAGRVTTCYEAAQFVWAARKFSHHYEKLQLYTAPLELYALTMLDELEEWRTWKGAELDPYMDLLLRHHQCTHGPHRPAAVGTDQVMRLHTCQEDRFDEDNLDRAAPDDLEVEAGFDALARRNRSASLGGGADPGVEAGFDALARRRHAFPSTSASDPEVEAGFDALARRARTSPNNSNND